MKLQDLGAADVAGETSTVYLPLYPDQFQSSEPGGAAVRKDRDEAGLAREQEKHKTARASNQGLHANLEFIRL